jgi:cation transport ATPase
VTNAVLDATRIVVCVVMRYDAVAAVNAVLQAVSQKLFAQAEDDFQRQLYTLFGQEEAAVWSYVQGAEVATTTTTLTVGAVIALGAGDTAPAAGVVLYGTALLDEWLATGAVQPVQKHIGERVAAASTVISGQIYLQVEEPPPPALVADMRTALVQAVARKSWTQQAGEASANRMAPRMLLAFGLSLPLVGINHAAAFLTTGFGNHLRLLGPYTVRNFLIPAAQLGIVIKDARSVEKANLVNTLLLDGRVLTQPALRATAKTWLHNLRQRPWLMPGVTPHRFAIYVLVESGDEELGRELVAELGLDDYFAKTLPLARAALVEQLQQGGRFICYVGTGQDDDLVLAKATVAIAHRGLATLTTNQAQVVLLDNDLRQLGRFFRLAAAFMAKQSYNLLTPIGLDLVDILTTLLLHVGLFYSVLFSYTGLLLSAAHARLPTLHPKAAPAEGDLTLPALPVIKEQ